MFDFDNYGMPYMGSKNKIAEEIIRYLPPAEHFYDLFGGGGAMTHCALLSGKYKYVHYNEFEPLVYKGFKMAVNGEFKNENRWISHKEFDELCGTDPYVAMCFSFGNCLNSYSYNPESEKFKEAVHHSIVLRDDSLLKKYKLFEGFQYTSEDNNSRRMELQSYIRTALDTCEVLQNTNKTKEVEDLKKMLDEVVPYMGERGSGVLQSLQCLARLQGLEKLGHLANINSDDPRLLLTNGSYEKVQLEKDCVVYCDPPYVNTRSYINTFDHNAFYKWLRDNDHTVYISEYYMPEDFYTCLSIVKHVSFSSTCNTTLRSENLYSNRKPVIQNPLEDW